MEIKLPKNIDTIDELNDWLKPTEDNSIQPYTRRKNKYCFHFTFNEYTQKVNYLMDDGYSVGSCKIENLNKYLIFKTLKKNMENERTDLPQIHLSAIDAKTKEEATEIVIHKMNDGSISIEWFPNEITQKALNCNQLMATFNKESKNKLIDFLNSEVTY